MQFAMRAGKMQRHDIDTIHVDLPRLGAILEACRQDHDRKRRLRDGLERAGVRTEVLRYEDFVADRAAYMDRLLRAIDIELGLDQIVASLDTVQTFQKVHSTEISDFVENHDEVLEAFGDAFVRW
jgi:hypothetical protein